MKELSGIYRDTKSRCLVRVQWSAWERLQIMRVDGAAVYASEACFTRDWLPRLHKLGSLYDTDYR